MGFIRHLILTTNLRFGWFVISAHSGVFGWWKNMPFSKHIHILQVIRCFATSLKTCRQLWCTKGKATHKSLLWNIGTMSQPQCNGKLEVIGHLWPSVFFIRYIFISFFEISPYLKKNSLLHVSLNVSTCIRILFLYMLCKIYCKHFHFHIYISKLQTRGDYQHNGLNVTGSFAHWFSYSVHDLSAFTSLSPGCLLR